MPDNDDTVKEESQEPIMLPYSYTIAGQAAKMSKSVGDYYRRKPKHERRFPGDDR